MAGMFFGKASEADLLNKSSCLAPALGVNKFIIITDIILVTLCFATKSDLMFNKSTSSEIMFAEVTDTSISRCLGCTTGHCSVCLFGAIGFYNEADVLESGSILIYSQKEQSIYTHGDRHNAV